MAARCVSVTSAQVLAAETAATMASRTLCWRPHTPPVGATVPPSTFHVVDVTFANSRLASVPSETAVMRYVAWRA